MYSVYLVTLCRCQCLKVESVSSGGILDSITGGQNDVTLTTVATNDYLLEKSILRFFYI